MGIRFRLRFGFHWKKPYRLHIVGSCFCNTEDSAIPLALALFCPSFPRLHRNHSRSTVRVVVEKFFSKMAHLFPLRENHVESRELNQTISSRAPPPRGTPGSLTQGNEECTPNGKRAKATSGGAKRRLRRREYRAWRRHCNKDGGLRVGPRPLARPSPQKTAQSRAKWFKQTVLWQRQFERKRSQHSVHFPTTPPLAYGRCLRFACLSVQGFAETLKLKLASRLCRNTSWEL